MGPKGSAGAGFCVSTQITRQLADYQLSVEIMSTFFTVLLALSLVGLVVGLVRPRWVRMPSRKRVSLVFISTSFVFAVLSSPTGFTLNGLFALLTLASLAGLIVGYKKPSRVRLSSSKQVCVAFGSAAALFLILFAVTLPASTEPSASTFVVATPEATSTVETPATGAHDATQAQTVAGTEQPAASAQKVSTTPAPAPVSSEPATLTDSAYMEQFEGTVMLYIQALGSDVMDGSAAIADSNVAQTSTKQSSDISAALTDFQQGQSDLEQAQSALQALRSKTPPDMATVQSSASEYLTSEALVLSLFIGHVNSDTLSMSDTSDVYTQMSRSNLYQGQMNAAIQQWETNNL
jgi:hypothetical protein